MVPEKRVGAGITDKLAKVRVEMDDNM